MKKKVLEIGCGHGFNTYLLSKNKKNEVTGIDFSKADIEVCRKRYPNLKFMTMDVANMKFKKEYFDEIHAIDILEHVDNLGKVLREVRRILKKEGYFYVNIPYYKSEKWLLKIRPTYFKDIHHVRVFNENELENLLKKVGIMLVRKKREGFLHHLELFFLLRRKINSKGQVSIGSWRDNIFTKSLHAFTLLFEPLVIRTPLVFFPVWLITIPIGRVINLVGNKFFPKSLYYEFIKK